MSKIILYTSGTTKDPKEVVFSWEDIKSAALRSIREIGLTKDDIVLDVYPANTIAHYTVTAFPAHYAGATLISTTFDPYTYIKLFKKYQPTYISLIPRHIEILEKTKEWEQLDMSCVRYMVMGTGRIDQQLIDRLKSKGINLISNWYGMTEMPPPVFVGNNSEAFDFTPKEGYTVSFSTEGECIINGYHTGDIFDVETKKFIKRKAGEFGTGTWKTKP